MTKKNAFRSAMLISALFAVATPEIAHANDFLKSLEGTWRGSGEIRQYGANKPTERTVCKITGKYSEATMELKTKGRCGTVSGSGRVNGALRGEAGTNAVTGNFIGRGSAAKSGNAMQGAIKGNQVTLKGPGPEDSSQQLTMVLSGNESLSLQLSIKGANGSDDGFSTINLKRQ